MEKMKYEKAVSKLEEIVSAMESGKMNLDELTTKLQEAKKLIVFCKERLEKTDEEIKKILNEESTKDWQ